MTLKEFSYECFNAGKRRAFTLEQDNPSPNFHEWWEAMQVFLPVKNTKPLDGVDCTECQKKLEEIRKVIDSLSKG